MSLFSFHGRGIYNGVIPHPRWSTTWRRPRRDMGGAPPALGANGRAHTDLSYVQFSGSQGIASLDMGFPVRYSHQATELVDPADIDGLVTLLDAALDRVTSDLDLVRAP